MNVVFRTDASLQIGTGHVMRCLTLADALREQGAACRFVVRELSGHLASEIQTRGYAVSILPLRTQQHDTGASRSPYEDWLGADWRVDALETLATISQPANLVIVDHYGLDQQWEALVRRACDRMLVIDDLADRDHACDLLLDQNLGRQATDYRPHVLAECRLLIGPSYALIRPEFALWREQSLNRRGTKAPTHVLVSLGGVDVQNVTCNVLDALQFAPLQNDARITVVLGPHAPWLKEVRQTADRMRWPTEVCTGVHSMAPLMCISDLAVGAVGGTAWERCCLGLPTVAIVLAANQRPAALALQQAGAVLLAEMERPSGKALIEALTVACEAEVLADLSRASALIVDGCGVERVAAALTGLGQ